MRTYATFHIVLPEWVNLFFFCILHIYVWSSISMPSDGSESESGPRYCKLYICILLPRYFPTFFRLKLIDRILIKNSVENKFTVFGKSAWQNWHFYAPAIFNVGVWGAYSITALHTYVRPICPSVPYVKQMVSIRYLLNRLVYWIQILYTGIIIKCRSSSI